jgi:hypothetical protein
VLCTIPALSGNLEGVRVQIGAKRGGSAELLAFRLESFQSLTGWNIEKERD